MAVDWMKIKNDYINGGGSYRKLAEKYGVTLSTLRWQAEKGEWVRIKQEQQHKISVELAQKTAEKISDAISDEAAAKARIRTKLIRMAENWIDRQCDTIDDTGDYRRIVQSCIELGIMGEEADSEALAKLDAVLSEIGGVV